MNKAKLIEAVQKSLGGDTSKAHAGLAVEAVIDGIKSGLKKEKTVQLIGFGTFKVAQRKARIGVNPKTGEQKWAYQTASAPSGMYKGVAVGEGFVFVGLGDSHIIALKEKTGELAWTGIVGDEPPLKGQAIPAGPTYVNGLVISGLANGTYTGVTDIKFYDVAGNLLNELTGTSSAVLITP